MGCVATRDPNNSGEGTQNNTNSDPKYEEANNASPESPGQENDESAPNLKGDAWISDIAEDVLNMADHETQNEQFLTLVPKRNRFSNLENRMKFIKTLGKGATCRVVLAIERRNGENNNNNNNDNKIITKTQLNNSTNERFALKQLRKDIVANIKSFQREATLLTKLKHENIVELVNCYIDKYSFYIATKYCYGGPLLDFITKCQHFSEQQASFYLKTILETINYCHNKNIVHRDLKPNNIMFNKTPILDDQKSFGFANDAKLIIIDFGAAIEIEDNQTYDKKVGTFLYLVCINLLIY